MTRPQLNESLPNLALQRSAKSGKLGGSFTLGEILSRPASLENLDYFMKLTHMLSRFFLTHILSKKAKMVGKPQKVIYDLVRLHVDKDGPERASTPEREIIVSQLDDLSDRHWREGHDTSENGYAGGLYPQTIGYPDAKSATSGEADGLHNLEESCSHTGPRGRKGDQTLSKDFSWTGRHIAEKFSHREQEAHGLSATGEIGQLSLIVTMNTRGLRATYGTMRERLCGK